MTAKCPNEIHVLSMRQTSIHTHICYWILDQTNVNVPSVNEYDSYRQNRQQRQAAIVQ